MTIPTFSPGGPIPLPRAVKQARGTFRGDRGNPREPLLAYAPLPPPPRGLSRGERATWRALAAAIDPMSTATVADRVAFRLMVEAVARARDLSRTANVYALACAHKLALTHLAQWGLTPASRGRVAMAAGEGRDDRGALAEFSPPPGAAP